MPWAPIMQASKSTRSGLGLIARIVAPLVLAGSAGCAGALSVVPGESTSVEVPLVRSEREDSSVSVAALSTLQPPEGFPYAGFGLAYDEVRSEIVLFGGVGHAGLSDATWIWRADAGWRIAQTPAKPSERRFASMTYDAVHRRVVLFGGRDRTQVHGDTWLWDGERWEDAHPPVSPEARAESAMAFDASRGVAVLFGGHAALVAARPNPSRAPPRLADTWLWDGTTWLRSESGSAPSARAYHAMAFDPRHGQVVLFGGRASPTEVLGDCWVWSGSSWSERPLVRGPSPRAAGSLVFDGAQQRLILHGGDLATYGASAPADDTWRFEVGDGTDGGGGGGGRDGRDGRTPIAIPLGTVAASPPKGPSHSVFVASLGRVVAVTLAYPLTPDPRLRAYTLGPDDWTAADESPVAAPRLSVTASPSPHALVSDLASQRAVWLARAADDANPSHVRAVALMRLGSSLRRADSATQLSMAPRVRALALQLDLSSVIYETLAWPADRASDAEPDMPIPMSEIDEALASLATLATRAGDGVRATQAEFDALPTATRLRVYARGLAPPHASISETEALDTEFSDSSVLRDAMVLAASEGRWQVAQRFADRVLELDAFDPFAAAVGIAREPAAQGALAAYFALVTQSQGACARPENVAEIYRYAERQPGPLAQFIVQTAGYDFAAIMRAPVQITETPIDPRGGLDANRMLARGVAERHELPRTAAASRFFEFTPPEQPTRRAAAPGIVCVASDQVTAPRAAFVELVRTGVYDDALSAYASYLSQSSPDLERCIARAHGPSSRALFVALDRIRHGGERAAEAFAALTRVEPGRFSPFARAYVLASVSAEGDVTSDRQALSAIAATDVYTWARGLGRAQLTASEGNSTPSAMLNALAHFAAGRNHEAALRLESLADITSEPAELRALAGVAYAFAGEMAEARRLIAWLGAHDSTSARQLAVEEAIARQDLDRADDDALPLAAWFASGPGTRRESRAVRIPELGRRPPSASCLAVTQGASRARTEASRAASLSRLIEATSGASAALRATLGSWAGDPEADLSEITRASVARVNSPALSCAIYTTTLLRRGDGWWAVAPDASLGEACARVSLRDEASLRALAFGIRRRLPVALARVGSFVEATEGLEVDDTRLDIAEARVLALGSLGRDVEAANLRIALLDHGVVVPLDGAALRLASRLRPYLRLLLDEEARFAFVAGEAAGVSYAALQLGLTESLVRAELASGALDIASRVAMAQPEALTLAEIMAAVDASPSSSSVVVWAIGQRRAPAADAARERRLATRLADRLRRELRGNPTLLDLSLLSGVASGPVPSVLRGLCEGIERAALRGVPRAEAAERVADLIDGDYPMCADWFRAAPPRSPDEEH